MAVLSRLGFVMLGMGEAATADAASGSGSSVSAPNNDEDWAWGGLDRASGPRDRSFSNSLVWKVIGRW